MLSNSLQVTKPKSAKAKAPTAKKPKVAKKPAAPKADGVHSLLLL